MKSDRIVEARQKDPSPGDLRLSRLTIYICYNKCFKGSQYADTSGTSRTSDLAYTVYTQCSRDGR